MLHPFTPDFLTRVRAELLLLSARFKETDLFRLHQTGELANIDTLPSEQRTALSSISRLRDELYSTEFRKAVERVANCGPLNARVDCAANVYDRGSQLLCHDDCISTRRISYILYVSDGDENAWNASDGGMCTREYFVHVHVSVVHAG